MSTSERKLGTPWTKHGPINVSRPKSGRTTNLIKKANEALERGLKVEFHNWELTEEYIRERGLNTDVPIVQSDEQSGEFVDIWDSCKQGQGDYIERIYDIGLLTRRACD